MTLEDFHPGATTCVNVQDQRYYWQTAGVFLDSLFKSDGFWGKMFAITVKTIDSAQSNEGVVFDLKFTSEMFRLVLLTLSIEVRNTDFAEKSLEERSSRVEIIVGLNVDDVSVAARYRRHGQHSDGRIYELQRRRRRRQQTREEDQADR